MKTYKVIKFIIRGNIIMILKNNNNQGVVLERLVAAKNKCIADLSSLVF